MTYLQSVKTFNINNDAFVMDAWGKDQAAENVTLIPDGNGELSAGMGMLVDKSDLGF